MTAGPFPPYDTETLKTEEVNATELEKEVARVLDVVADRHGFQLPRLVYLRMAHAVVRTVAENEKT